MRERTSIKYTNKLFIAVLSVFTLFQLAFYKMMIEMGDNAEHMDFVRSIFSSNPVEVNFPHIRAYPLYHITTGIVSFFCLKDFNVAGMVVLMAANIVAVLIIRHILYRYLEETDVFGRYIVDVISIAYLLFNAIAGPLTDGRFYQRQCGPNPWHNPTITFVRPIGLIVFLLFVDVIESMRSGKESRSYIKQLIGFSAVSAISVLAKPSFAMVFLPAMGIYVLICWLRDLKGRFPDAMRLLAAVVPTVIILLYQVVFFQFDNEATAGTVKYMWGGFAQFTPEEIVKVSIATFPVPLLGLLLYGRQILDCAETKLAYLALVIGWIEMFMFTNGYSGDFSWGYDLAVGLATVVVLVRALTVKKWIWRALVLLGVFGWQVISGINYVLQVYVRGGETWF